MADQQHALVTRYRFASNMDSLQLQIEEIARSASRYSVAEKKAKMDILLTELRQVNPYRAAQLEAEHFLPLGFMDYPTAVRQLLEVTRNTEASEVDRMFAFSSLAKTTRGRVPKLENVEYRRRALDLARKAGDLLREAVILTNWGITDAEDGDAASADRVFAEAALLLPRLSAKDQPHRVVAEIRSRTAATQGKRALRALRHDTYPVFGDKYEPALRLFEGALAEVPADAHRQVNTRIELAAELVNLGSRWIRSTMPDVIRILHEAHRGLNAHQCENCEAYYLEVSGRTKVLEGGIELRSHAQRGIMQVRRGLADLQAAEQNLRKRLHPKADEVHAYSGEAMALIDIESRPRKIFLSHSSRDKDLIRQVKTLLESLAYEPWLDEDAMAAGVLLERGLLRGMQASCAAVFFVTDNFVDANYLASEIDYAVAEKRKKGSHFAIITLVLSGRRGLESIPELLRPYVFKTPATALEAVTELVRALPIAALRPQWRDAPSLSFDP